MKAWVGRATGLIVLFVAVATVDAVQQRPDISRPTSTGRASVEARVTRTGGIPVSGVRLTVVTVGEPREMWSGTTGSDGRVHIESLPPRRVRIDLHHQQYLVHPASRRQPGLDGAPVELRDGQALKITALLTRGGVIAGRVTTPTGEPISDVNVRAYRTDAGAVGLRPASARAYRSNDIGEYRITNLEPGRYFVAATYRPVSGPTSPDGETGYVPTWYPGSVFTSEASAVPAEADREVGSIDFVLHPVRLSSVHGLVRDSNGVPRSGVQVSLAAPAGSVSLAGAVTTRTQRDGTFRFSSIVPGDYHLQAVLTSNGRGGPGLSAQELMAATVSVHVSEEPGGVEVNPYLTPAPMMRGRLEILGQLPTATRLRIFAIGTTVAQVRSEWSVAALPVPLDFQLPVLPGQYFVRVRGLPQGWVVESVSHRGNNVADRPVAVDSSGSAQWVIRISQRGATLTGNVMPVAPGTTVIAISTARDTWSAPLGGVHLAAVGTDGRFTVSNLPPGSYGVVAAANFDSRNQFHPDVLDELLGRSEPVTLGPGAAVTLNLRAR